MVHHRQPARLKRSFRSIVIVVGLMILIQAGTAWAYLDIQRLVSWIFALQAALGTVVFFGLFAMRRTFLSILAEEDRINRDRARTYRHDSVTGALNRAAFIDLCETALRTRKPGCGYFLHIDLDYLKRINDSLGHAKGDAALRHAAEIARGLAPDSAFGRLGGDEFALLVMNRPHGEAMAFAERYLAQLAMTFWHESQPMSLSASIGLARIEPDVVGFDELVHRADLALYESKRNGRGQATMFEDEMLRELRHTRRVERDLRAAILLGELELVYQPLATANGSIVACEALVRWRHSLRGVIPPAEFIPVAERTILIDHLGEFVLRRACLDMQAFPELMFGVNFSANQFKRDGVVSMVEAVLAETGTSPSRLVLEITESMAMSDDEDVRRRLTALRGRGVRIALDDFGAGFTGFAYLQSFPVDAIKIDRSFVSKLGTNSASNVLVTALVNVAHAAGIRVVAEGVETEEQHRLAKAAGADMFQGFLLARPMGLTALGEHLREKNAASAAQGGVQARTPPRPLTFLAPATEPRLKIG
ncbi:putative bifunctional diguanylate cyclase/phosphodiesterase [Jiella pacifica]|uniref:EAL domain-containing protein n=1 Tax=Jiella pacifica TaxID=2696469 RepID=A0A6N9TAY6_9HYPH|nr:bifunctional diguanylate cyclase/phosphodiesterase [Jiella pacifica]NDW06859.1 EAL domain-containing protein [Jiella pacifica]